MSPKLHRLSALGAVVATVAVALAISAATAGAATGVTTSGVTGPVREPSQPVLCSDWGNVLSSVFGYPSGAKDVTVNGPTVWAAPLANGSQSQYVMYRADVWDMTTQQWYYGSWTSQYLATTTAPASLPQVTARVPAWDRIGVRIHVAWWDPVSQRYTGVLDYTVNAYYNLDYSPVYFSTSAC